MAQLFLYAGVFLLIAALVGAVCFWFVRQEEQKNQGR
jgi:hypothetical protein